MHQYQLSAIVEREEKLYVALCPELDVASQGSTVAEALANLNEAVQLYIETADPPELQKLPSEPPLLTTLNVAV